MQRRISPPFLGASTGRARALEQQSETGAGRGVSSSLKSLSDTDEVRVSSLSDFFCVCFFFKSEWRTRGSAALVLADMRRFNKCNSEETAEGFNYRRVSQIRSPS